MNYLLIVVLKGFTDYESCAAQAVHENATLAAQGEELVAFCIVQAPYAPITTLRPTARPEGRP